MLIFTERTIILLHRKDDYPPRRLMEEPIKSGPFKGERLKKDDWDRMLDEYYQLHKWDKETGWCTEISLKLLGLTEILEMLNNVEKLPGKKLSRKR